MSQSSLLSLKVALHAGLIRLAAVPATDTADALAALYHPDARWNVAHPVNTRIGIGAVEAGLFQPLKAALPDLGRVDNLVAIGRFNDAVMLACQGHLVGTFSQDLFGIPASHKPVFLRYGEAHRLVDDRIAESWMLFDFLDLMRQAGVWPLTPSLGAEERWPAPAGQGLQLDQHDPVAGADSLALVLAMHQGLGQFDGRSLASMDHARFWEPHFMWYGPAGIGTARGLSGFETIHQIPFLRAFPDRRGGQHFVRIAEGPFVVTGGWPSVTATHSGPGFLGMPGTGRPVGMRVMDFYHCRAGLIAENWVPIDVLDLLAQIGFDVFERLAHLRGNRLAHLPTPPEQRDRP